MSSAVALPPSIVARAPQALLHDPDVLFWRRRL